MGYNDWLFKYIFISDNKYVDWCETAIGKPSGSEVKSAHDWRVEGIKRH